MSIRTTNYQFTTLQQLFNDMYLGLLKQGGPCMSDSGGCFMRRTVNGQERACAVGLLLTDSVAVKQNDDGTLSDAWGSPRGYVNYFEKCGIERNNEEAYDLMARMQGAHDGSVNGEGWLEEFKSRAADVATHHGLKVPEEPEPTEPGKAKPKPKKGKRYAASVYRRAAAILEANPDKHVYGYGNPFADKPENQCFCAIAACDIVLESDGITPEALGITSNDKHVSNGKVYDVYNGTTVNVTGLNLYAGPHVNAAAGQRFETIGNINDRQPRNGAPIKYTPTGSDVMPPDGNKAVIKALRRIAACLEHGGKVRSPKKPKTEGKAV